MKSLQITLLLLLFGMFVHAQEITIEGQRVQIQEIQELKNPCVFSDRCPEMTPGSLMQYFYDYFNVPTLQKYRTFLSAADWFDLDQAGFENWKKYISQNPLIADAFCVFELKEKTYGIVAHYLEKGNYRARQNFLCESKNGKWHAMTSQMDADLAEVSHYLSLLDALKFKTYLNSNQGSSLSENHKRLEDSNSKGLLKEEIKKLVANPKDEAQLEKEMKVKLLMT